MRGPIYTVSIALASAMGLTNSLLGHVAWYLEDHNPHEHKLVAEVDCGLLDVDIGGKASRQCAREVHAVQLEDE